MKTLTIEIGALGRPLTEQLKGHASFDELEFLESDRCAITRALIRGYISDSVAEKARAKLMKRIQAEANRFAKAFNAAKLNNKV